MTSNKTATPTGKKKTYHPKSAGNDVNDISFKPNIVRLFNCEKPAGNFGIGLELKSATWSSRRWRISSGMSGISETKERENQWICQTNAEHLLNIQGRNGWRPLPLMVAESSNLFDWNHLYDERLWNWFVCLWTLRRSLSLRFEASETFHRCCLSKLYRLYFSTSWLNEFHTIRLRLRPS